jgi:predicted nucleotidyltransferase component of viral defense system
MISAISVKDRLKNQAVASGKTFQEALTAYGLERTVYRLSVSEYVERFTLKGGIFLYALFEGEFARATRDIDLLAKNMPNNMEDMKKVFENIFSIECDDALRYDLDTLEVIDMDCAITDLNHSAWSVHKVNLFEAFDEAGMTNMPRPM